MGNGFHHYLIVHPRISIYAAVCAASAAEALAMCRQDDPCWNEIEVEKVGLQGHSLSHGPCISFHRLGSLGPHAGPVMAPLPAGIMAAQLKLTPAELGQKAPFPARGLRRDWTPAALVEEG